MKVHSAKPPPDMNTSNVSVEFLVMIHKIVSQIFLVFNIKLSITPGLAMVVAKATRLSINKVPDRACNMSFWYWTSHHWITCPHSSSISCKDLRLYTLISYYTSVPLMGIEFGQVNLGARLGVASFIVDNTIVKVNSLSSKCETLHEGASFLTHQKTCIGDTKFQSLCWLQEKGVF